MSVVGAGVQHSDDQIMVLASRNDETSLGRRDPETSCLASCVTINLFGALTVHIGTQQHPVLSRKLQAVIAYLCFRKDFSESRERLAGLLWSESDEDKARASLRQTIGDLRHLFGEMADTVVLSPKLRLGLNRTFVSTDIDAVMHAAEYGKAHPTLLAMEKPIDDLLLDIEDIDPEFRIWLIAKRRAYSDRLIYLLERTVAGDGGVRTTAVVNAQAVLALDGSHEIAARVLMKHYAREGSEARALKVYGDLWKLLEEQYDSEPSPETQKLVVEIKRGQLFAPQSKPSESKGKPKPIGLFIGAIDVLSINAEGAFRLQAFRQQLATNLVRFREWFVFDEVDRIGDEQEQNDPARYFKIQLLPVAIGNNLRVSVHLKDAATGLFLWSETVNLFEQGWTEAHFKTIRRIATTLNVHVSSARLHRITEANSAPPDIYDRWLRAQSTMMAHNGAQWETIAETLRGIVAEAPNFSPGFRTLTNLENARHIVNPGVRRSQGRHLHAIELARRAVELDPVDSRAHLCLSWSYVLAAQGEDAMIHANTAIDLNDNDPWTLVSAGNILGFCGDIDGAVIAADHALFVSPMQSRAHLAYDGNIRFMKGDYSACVTAITQAGSAYPGASLCKIAALAHLGRADEAGHALQDALGLVKTRWADQAPATDATAFAWFADQFPILDPAIKDRLGKGLALAQSAI
jgi:DNA-binding SARP family transcriptional activator